MLNDHADYGRPPDLSVHGSAGGTSRAGALVGVVVVGVVVLLAVAVTALIVHLRAPADPSGVVESFLDAQADLDCATIDELTVSGDEVEACEDATDEVAVDVADITEVESGDQAAVVTAEFRATFGEAPHASCADYESTFSLQNDDGQWLIDTMVVDDYVSLPGTAC